MSGFAVYTEHKAIRREAEITTMAELLTVLRDAGGAVVSIEVPDPNGRRQRINAMYIGEASSVKR